MTARQKKYLESMALRLNGDLFDCPDCNGRRFKQLAEELLTKLRASYLREAREGRKAKR